MEECSHGLDVEEGLILKVLGVDLCARAILDHVPVTDLVRSERVCKGWQRAVQTYLRSCRSLSLYDTKCTPMSAHRSIYISVDDDFLLPYGILEKFGSSMMKVVTERSNDEYFELIASQCPHLQEIAVGVTDGKHYQLNLIKKFNQMKRIQILYLYHATSYKTDEILGKLFKNIDCENIKLKFQGYTDLTGSFLQSIGKSNLKLLSITQSYRLDISSFLTAMHVLRNVTTLILNRNTLSVMNNIHLLLVEMPQLEDLHLCNYYKSANCEGMSKETIRAFSGLVNLRRLTVKHNNTVTDALLEALARGCKKLEYLNIRGCPLDCVGVTQLTARGLAALCRRSPSAVTTFYCGYFKDETYDEQFKARVRDNPLLPELASRCCLDMTPQWWESTCRASQGRMHPVELNSNCNSVQHQDQQHKLKIAVILKPWTR